MRLIAIATLTLALTFASIAAAQSTVPRKATDFKITSSAGKTLHVADFKGDVLVIQFLDTGCGHCQATARAFTKMQGELGSQGLHFMGVAFNHDVQATPSLVNEFVSTQHVGFPVGIATREQTFNYLGVSVMKNMTVPQIMVIDRKGMVRAQSKPEGSPEIQDPAQLRFLLEKLLKEPK